MNIFKALFGSSDLTPEEEKKNAEQRRFDLMKFDGVKALKMGQFDYAVRCFDEALSIENDLEVRDYLSQALIHTGKLQLALGQLQLLSVAEPQNVDIMRQMAHVAYLMEDYQQMTGFLDQALAVAPDNADLHFIYARAALGTGDLVGAIARLTKCLVIAPEHGDAHLLRAQTLMKMGDLQGAEDDVKWLMERTDGQEDVLLLAARLAKAKGLNVEALARYGEVIEANPFHIDAYSERGQLRYEQGDRKGAEEDLKKVLELNPQQMADVSGSYSAEGVEQQMKRAYSAINPLGL